jgi:hypothetical protein
VSNQSALGGLAQADKAVIALCGGWALLSLSLFGLCGLLTSCAVWFPLVVSLLKIGAFLIATALCWRNAKRADIVSGGNVWQAIAVGLACYALGDITVMLWRSLWGSTSMVALGAVCYGASYLFLAIGLVSAVLPRQMILSLKQTLGIATMGTLGIVLACWLNFYMPREAVISGSSSDIISGSSSTTQNIAQNLVQRAEAVNHPKEAAVGLILAENQAPALIDTIDQRLGRVAPWIELFYVVGDCLLIVMAAALLVAFWGGSYAETWKLIALAGLCLYVADMFLIYQTAQAQSIQGAMWQIFWILSALFFGLGAGVEHGVSRQMQHRQRRQWL